MFYRLDSGLVNSSLVCKLDSEVDSGVVCRLDSNLMTCDIPPKDGHDNKDNILYTT